MGSCPRLPFGPPPQLASWLNKGLDWGPANDVPTFKSRIRDLLKRDVSLVKVMQVMLVRRVLPCQRRSLRMWDFNREGPQTIQQFFGVTLEEMYGSFFGSRIKCPYTTEDAGLNCNRPDTQVSNYATEHVVFLLVTTSFRKNFSRPGLDKKGGEDQVFGPPSRRLAGSFINQDA